MRSLWFEKGALHLIDQTKLPFEFKVYKARTARDVIFCIKEMVVRGAPAIGCAAAYGYALGRLQGERLPYERLLGTRPTAYDLRFSLDNMVSAEGRQEDLLEAAGAYTEAIVEKCRRIGQAGAHLIKPGRTVLTHCNAGALATVDWGTALAPMRVAHRSGVRFLVLVDETRPRLQGAYLTAWELSNEGIAIRLIADNAAGHYMSRGLVDLVIVGADRVCRNGDIANKIGTYEKAVVAKEAGVPFYVAAPISTVDLSLGTGGQIPIEERPADEVLFVRGRRVTCKGITAGNPAFDVTPARYITGLITEFDILRPKDIKGLKSRPFNPA